MEDISKPRIYPQWSNDKYARADDAAYNFGYHLIQHCRNEAILNLPPDLTDEQRIKCIHSIDLSLHNVMDMIEGYWPLTSGQEHRLEYNLSVSVLNKDFQEIEKKLN